MKKTWAALALLIGVPFYVSAAQDTPSPKIPRADKNIRINRLLLAQYSKELGQFRRAQRGQFSELTERRLLGLRTKIRALKEDAQRLKSRLPMTSQADAFLANFIQRRGDEVPLPKKTASQSSIPVPQFFKPLPSDSATEPLHVPQAITEPEPAPSLPPAQAMPAEPPPVPEPAPALAEKTIIPPSLPSGLPENVRLHEEALQFVAARDFKKAAIRYEEIVINNPNDDEAYLLLGHVYLMTGQYDKAEFAYYNAVHIDKENFGEIIPFYQSMIIQSPNDDQAYQFLGYAYVILGDAPRAKDAYLESLRINPANIESRNGLILITQKFGI